MASRLTRFKLGGVEYAVLSEETRPAADLSSLTSAEREVMGLVADGLSNVDIAKRRGTSVRTVANQLAAMFKKLGVGSRSELVARYRGGGQS
jgi:DNA-binding CsgD family transcriptional regulator